MELNDHTIDQICSTGKDSQNAPQSPFYDQLYHTSPHANLSSYQANSFHFSPLQSPPTSTESKWSLCHRPTLFHHCICSFQSHKGSINSIAVMKSGLVLTASGSTRIRVWRQLDYKDIGYIKASSSKVHAILAPRDMLFTSHKDHKIRVWNVGAPAKHEKFSPKKITTLPKSSSKLLFFSKASHVQQHKDVISCMAYYHAEGILYTGSWDRSIKAWSIREQKCIDSFYAHGDNINALVVNQEDGCLFTASSDGTVKIWRRDYGGRTHNLTMTLKIQLSPINALALSVSPSGNFVYSGSSDGCIHFWVKEKFSCRYNSGGFLDGHRLAVLCLMAVNNLVISGSEDTTIRIWMREEGTIYHECLVILEGHKGPVKCVNACVEKDNRKILKAIFVYSASWDNTFKVWRIKVLDEMNDTYIFNNSDYTDNDDGNDRSGSIGGRYSKSIEFEMSPVLSPLWVEKKLQVGCSFN